MNYKFRGKRIDNGEWVYGFYVQSEDEIYICNFGGYDERYGIGNHGEYKLLNKSYKVIPETVGQFTGMNDSTKWEQLTPYEKNVFYRQNRSEDGKTIKYQTTEDVKHLWKGKEIYEGDLLQVWRSVGAKGQLRGKYCYPLPVEYCTDWASFVVVDKPNKVQYIINQQFGAYEIVGTIYEVAS